MPFWIGNGTDVPSTSTEIIKALMNDRHRELEPYLYLDEIITFCLQADLAVLEQGTDTRVKRPLALLDDRNSNSRRDERRGDVRPWRGALTAHQLYRELSKKVTSSSVCLASGTSLFPTLQALISPAAFPDTWESIPFAGLRSCAHRDQRHGRGEASNVRIARQPRRPKARALTIRAHL